MKLSILAAVAAVFVFAQAPAAAQQKKVEPKQETAPAADAKKDDSKAEAKADDSKKDTSKKKVKKGGC
jgi:hypothetical protein